MTRDDSKLASYRSRRSFAQTPEPRGRAARPRRGAKRKRPRFVVQEHHARRLHWDLRLEHEGVLVSWALPRGFPDDPREKRLAVHTEDHPIEYLDFEGSIPAGEYGAGTMTIWDTGEYDAEKFTDTEVVVHLHGHRVNGRFALFQTRDKDWLLRLVPVPRGLRPSEPTPASHRMGPPEPGRDQMPTDLEPMLATLSKLPADQDEWGYEIKWDGVRALAYGQPGRLRLVSRNLLDISAQYPEVRGLTRTLGARQVILDGELVALDARGRPSFQALQRRMHLTSEAEIRRRQREVPVTYIIFDLLFLDGRLLFGMSYEERRRELEALGLSGSHWHTPGYQRGDGVAFLQASREQQLEGIVAKRLNSGYQPGRRSRDWLKIKNVQRQEFVIGGWIPGAGRRSGELGALLMGYYATGNGGELRLRFAGKVGTGFDTAELRRLKELLEPLRIDASPFSGRQPERGATFVEPRLVCEVAFSEWTKAGTLRHPSYQGLRDDKQAIQVVREVPAPPPDETEAPSAGSPPGVRRS
ncbi:non-homologous end-joining DNA ligase [Actinopolymorpha alba]|uniref:non-homologous end-joining DNA ligase n=1 Tax=Actinopolymorpha alba TaxID=533267 RepID=UPI00036FCE38|nr:non-homologous end-joining DNA ligase [Actinopolymorpha alba]